MNRRDADADLGKLICQAVKKVLEAGDGFVQVTVPFSLGGSEVPITIRVYYPTGKESYADDNR